MTLSLPRREFLGRAGATMSVAAFIAACGGPLVHTRDTPGQEAGDATSPIVTALRYGISAPSPHNTQPWRFTLTSDHEALLFVDPARLLPMTDPPARQTHIGHGTLLEVVALAAPLFGHRAEIEELPAGPVAREAFGRTPTARIRVVPDPTASVGQLSDAIVVRRTSRLAHDEFPVSDTAAARIEADAGSARVAVRVIREPLAPLIRVAQRAMAIEVGAPAVYEESRVWFRFSAEEVARRGDGLNVEMTGTDSPAARAFLTPKNFASAANQRRFLTAFDAAVAATRAFVTLATPDNTMADWIATGRAYVRAQLAGDAIGLRMHPVTQALQEYPEMDAVRAELAALVPVAAPARLQMLVRLGRTPVPALSPRRPLAAMVMPA
jgi:hypothetical protein